ncbi:hypothetical protein BC833DRAFT_529987 [Globomyces pollinis-pini]|nr:hypothetical protein BC833DRAFT_529987 [Globomyces pollinis-pini]
METEEDDIAPEVTPDIIEIDTSELAKICAKHWKVHDKIKFKSNVVDDIWKNHLQQSQFALKQIILLEFTHYLELYLWPHFDPNHCTNEHIFSIALLVNEKFRQNSIGIWTIFENDTERFSKFFVKLLELLILPLNQNQIDLKIRNMLLTFLIHSFASLEIDFVRTECLKLTTIGIWTNICDERREIEINKDESRVKLWKRVQKKLNSGKEMVKNQLAFDHQFLSKMIIIFYQTMDNIIGEKIDPDSLAYCERFLEFLIDLLAQLQTRRFFNILFQDHLVIPTCSNSQLVQLLNQQMKSKNNRYKTSLFLKQFKILQFYAIFQIDDITGMPLNRQETLDRQHKKMADIQKLCFVNFKDELKEFVFASVASLETAKGFKQHFENVSDETIIEFCKHIGIRTIPLLEKQGKRYPIPFILDAIVYQLQRHPTQLELINYEPLYPDESFMFDDVTIPQNRKFTNQHCQAIPKLNIQFLTFHDYLLRNFQLYKLETAFSIRQDIEDVVLRLNPRYNPDHVAKYDQTVFGGWSRMAVPLNQLQVEDIGQPRLTEITPSYVKADITYSLDRYSPQIKSEWDSLKMHDTLFLVSLQMLPDLESQSISVKETTMSGSDFRKKFGIKHIRGCEVFQLLSDEGDPIYNFEAGKELNENGEAKIASNNRTIRVLLDTNQYHIDTKGHPKGDPYEIYGTFNVLVRRNASQNNFKSVLETIRDLMQSELVVPDWLQDVLLGYGDRYRAHYTHMENPTQTIDFGYTFLNWNHVVSSFPDKTVVPVKEKKSPELRPPFLVTFPTSDFKELQETNEDNDPKRKRNGNDEEGDVIKVKSYKFKSFIENPKMNTLPFTKAQIEAIRSGCSTGLTLIVGPPGTGKTDVAVQIISNLYLQYPNAHMLLIARSNQALNHLFEKIAGSNIKARHLLRLGHGQGELSFDSGETSWGKSGRINSFLELRLSLLSKAEELTKSLDISPDHAATCETCSYLFTNHIESRWLMFKKDVLDQKSSLEDIKTKFPFKKYFEVIKPAIFEKPKTVEELTSVIEESYKYIKEIFHELEEVRPFELLRSNKDRSNYVLVKEARIIAMTSTHASLKRRELVRLGFKYDTVVMEEAGQMLEVETFVPLLLQTHDTDLNRSPLQRVILIGDHHQLPPIVQNQALAKYSNMEQSLFARLIRLGVPKVDLDHQGRSRPTITDLFRWNYPGLKDLTFTKPEYQFSNAGFAHEYQMVNVEEYNGVGESAPRPHFIQNLGEAEYVVATYMYMRLLGYPAESIAILTTYNGQKELIYDVLNRRCAWNPLFQKPKVSTVDQFQGQQADYILLSLVRTKTVGHLRDIRRLIVALSRARLGLYVFGRCSVFKNCIDLKPSFSQLLSRPTKLHLVLDEKYGDVGRKFGSEAEKGTDHIIEDVIHMGKYVHQMTQQQIEWMKSNK